MRKFTLMLALAAAATPSPALAENWVRYTRTPAGNVYYYDSDSLNYVGGQVRVWERVDHTDDPTILWRESRNLVYIDCTNATYAIRRHTAYRATGRVVHDYVYPENRLHWNPAPSGTSPRALIRALC